MLSDIGLILMGIISPILVLLAYRQGIKDRQNVNEGKPLAPIMPKPKPIVHQTKLDAKYAQILSNIDNYDGTTAGQKEVKS
jgi:hypothetical protein